MTVWDALQQIFSRFGYPEEAITDNGTEFTAVDAFRQHGIRLICTTPLRPQSNGMVERFHRTLKDTIRKCTNNVPRDWYKYLHKALWAYRMSPQVTQANRSLYEALFGMPSPQVSERRLEIGLEETIAREWREIYYQVRKLPSNGGRLRGLSTRRRSRSETL